MTSGGLTVGTETDCADFFLISQTLPSLRVIASSPSVSLSFGPIAPERIEIAYWDTDWKALKGVSGTSFELIEGKYTYRVIAHFKSGTVYYGFNGERAN